MHIHELHEWPGGRGEALKIQHQFKDRIVLDGSPGGIGTVAGVDTALDQLANILYAAVSLYSFPELEPLERTTASGAASFPYIPGLHAFREGPVIIKALSRLRTVPDLIIFAAHGIAHPRRFGMASHLGLILDIPSIGCARKILVGEHAEVGDQKGDSVPLMLHNIRVGTVYRSRSGVKPIFVSPGHRCSTDDAVRIVAACLSEYRIPEPLRAAHRLANKLKRTGNKRK